MNIRPLHDRVVIRRQEEEKHSVGCIVLPESSQEKSNQGEVVAVGSGHRKQDGSIRPLSVSVGDKVIFRESFGLEKEKVDGQEVLIMSECDILGVFE